VLGQWDPYSFGNQLNCCELIIIIIIICFGCLTTPFNFVSHTVSNDNNDKLGFIWKEAIIDCFNDVWQIAVFAGGTDQTREKRLSRQSVTWARIETSASRIRSRITFGGGGCGAGGSSGGDGDCSSSSSSSSNKAMLTYDLFSCLKCNHFPTGFPPKFHMHCTAIRTERHAHLIVTPLPILSYYAKKVACPYLV
jgi:hypothetical protein